MVFNPNVWNQLKNLTADAIIAALLKDGWAKDPASRDATIAYIKKSPTENKRVVIHYHPQKTYGPSLLKGLLTDIGWTEEDLKRLKLVKK